MRTKTKRWRLLATAAFGAVATLTLLTVLRQQNLRETLQRRFWNPFYDRLAIFYDAVDWLTCNTTHRLRRYALRFLPPSGAHVLEVGFGSGRLHVELASQYAMAGLDLAQGMVALTQQRLAARGLCSDLRQGDVAALPWPDATFDAVLSTFAFSAFPDPKRALDEMGRVLKLGGRIIIADAGRALDGNRVASLFASLWELLGDAMRDERPLLEAQGLAAFREDYGPWRSVHVTVGVKPNRRE